MYISPDPIFVEFSPSTLLFYCIHYDSQCTYLLDNILSTVALSNSFRLPLDLLLQILHFHTVFLTIL